MLSLTVVAKILNKQLVYYYLGVEQKEQPVKECGTDLTSFCTDR